MRFLIGFPLFIVAPCAIAAWLGTRVRSPLVAFALAWIATPLVSVVLTVVLAPVLRELIPANIDGGAIMIPSFGIVTGAIAGIVAAMIVIRRGRELAPKQDGSPP